MFNNIYAEIIKLLKKKMFWFTQIVLLIIVIFSFYQKAFNINSGMYQPEIVTSNYMCIFNLATISVFSFYYAIIIFGLVSSQDFECNCMSYIILKYKRLYFNIIKIVSCIIVILITGLTFSIIGYVEGALFKGSIQQINLYNYFFSLLNYLLICMSYGMVSYLLVFIFKSAPFGVITYIIFSFLENYINNYIGIFKKVTKNSNNLMYYGFNKIIKENDKQIIFAIREPIYKYIPSLLFILSFIFIIFIVAEIIALLRDYDA